jgi:NMD protein affecting ribosome stability and mRNA decay
MKSRKRYTNTTITKRVDHEGGGAHRGPRSPAEPLVCTECGATYQRRRWVQAGTPVADTAGHRAWTPHRPTVCPACARIRTGVPSGYLRLRGDFFGAHRAEIEQLLLNESRRTATDNPLARIMSWERPRRHELAITTTTEHLAQRLGHAVEKAYGGKVRYDFSHENKVARVDWRRD